MPGLEGPPRQGRGRTLTQLLGDAHLRVLLSHAKESAETVEAIKTRQHHLHKPRGQRWTPTFQINMYESCLLKPIMRYEDKINSHEEAFCECMRGYPDQSNGTAHSQNMDCT